MNLDLSTYTLKRSKRAKSVALRVIEQNIVVTAPMRYAKRDIDAFVFAHQSWIEKQFKKQSGLELWQEKQRFEDGGQFQYLGRWIELKLTDTDSTALIEDVLHLPHSTPDIQQTLYQWYQQQAFDLLCLKTDHIAEQLKQTVHKVQIGKFKSKWGSCHQGGVIKYSWPIIQAPEKIIDYIVIHEVAHLIEMNHSNRFWAIVETLCPTHKERRRWLKQQSFKLSFDLMPTARKTLSGECFTLAILYWQTVFQT